MLDFIRDIYASFRQTSLERVKSPFLGPFVFSWLGFNWQMLAVIFFSTKSIEERLSLINKSFDVGDYIFAPICTTALIVIILPRFNKFITWVQDKPNSDTVEMSLVSKIKIAELQQSLAENEARKKLADKKEERFIEENIVLIKQDHEKAIANLKNKENKISNLMDAITELQGKLAKAETMLKVEQESKSQTQNELIIEKDNNRTLGDQIIKIKSELNKLKSNLSLSKETYEKTLDAHDELKKQLDITKNSIIATQYIYPHLMKPTKINDSVVLKFNDNAGVALNELNEKLKRQEHDIHKQ